MDVDLEGLKPMLRAGDLDGAARFLASCGTPIEVSTVCHKAGRDLYWKDKDLDASVCVLGCGIRFAMDFARAAGSAEAIELLGQAKGMNYDVGSFCWPGWDEPGILIWEPHINKGRAAAAENLRLAIELERGPFPMANAHWLVGAYHLVDRQWDKAIAAFGRAVDCAARHPDLDFMGLMASYVALAAHLAGQDSALGSFVVTAERLNEDSKRQAATAWRVFCGSPIPGILRS